MKKFLIYIAAVLLFTGCSDWTEVESKYEPDELPVGEGRTEEYYANLRAFKSTMKNRKISFAWYGGWTGTGSYGYSSMAGLPDSLDIVSLWGGWDFTDNEPHVYEAKRKDMEYVQRVKGTKVVATDLIGSFDEEKIKEFGWEGELDPQGDVIEMNRGYLYTAPITPVQEEAIRKYARWVVDRCLALGYDGYDIDYEIGWGSKGTLVEYYHRMIVYVDEISKFMGPKSGTDKLFIIDGAIHTLPTPEMALCFDWLVIQAYEAANYTNLNTGGDRYNQRINRFAQAVDRIYPVMSVDEIARRTIMTEDYEQGRGANGGVSHVSEFNGTVNSLLGMALWQPQYDGLRYERSGGCGAYHVEYEYAARGPISGFYPFMRQAIQVMNPASPEKEQKQ